MNAKILIGNAESALQTLPKHSVQMAVTSPPYWGLRQYCNDPKMIGMEQTPEEYLANLTKVFWELWRVLKPNGTLWVNIGDTYATGGGSVGRKLKHDGGDQGDRFLRAGMIETQPNRKKLSGYRTKELIGIPWQFALAMRRDGWIIRDEIIWSKPNPLPSSQRDRVTRSHEFLFMFVKQPKYEYSLLKEPAAYAGKPRGGSSKRYNSGNRGSDRKVYDTRTKRSVWTIRPASHPTHKAVFPRDLIAPCISAGSCPGDTVLDPFLGSGTTVEQSLMMNRHVIGIEINPQDAQNVRDRFQSANAHNGPHDYEEVICESI